MAQGGTITVKAILDHSGFTRGLNQMKSGMGAAGAAGTAMGGNIANAARMSGTSLQAAAGNTTAYDVALGNLAAQGASLALGKLKQIGMAVLDASMSFETSMSKVQALSGATGEDLQELRDVAKDMGATTQFSASQCADALGYMALAGWDNRQMVAALPGVLNLAAAGQMDLAQASDMVTDYLSAFGMEAQEAGRMVDVMAYAQAKSNTSADQLGQALKNCAANANAAGLTIEDTTAALAMLANQGLKGSEAGTALNAIMRDMTSRMNDGAIAIGDTNVKVMDAQGNFRSFADIIADVEAATDGMGDAEKAAALQSTFTADSIKGLNMMLNSGSDELKAFTEELYGSEGAAEDMAAVMNDNLAGDVEKAKAGFEGLAITVGERLNGAFRGVVQFVTGAIIPALSLLADNADVLVVVMAGVGAAIVALKWGSIVNGIGLVRGAFTALGAAFAANPFGIVILAITAVVAAFVYLYRTNETVRNAINNAWKQIKSVAQDTWGKIAPYIQQAMEAAAPVVQQAMDIIGQAFQFWADNILPILINGFVAIMNIVSTVMPVVMNVVTVAWSVINAAFQFFSDNILPVLVAAFNTVNSVITTVMNAVVPVVQNAWNAIKSVFSVVLGFIYADVTARFNAVKSIIQSVMNYVQPIIKTAWDRIKSYFSIAQQIVGTVTSAFNSIKSAMINPITQAQDKIKSMLDKIKGYFPLSIGKVFSNLQLPHIKVNPGSAPYGIAGKGSLPSFSVSWYAKGGIFDNPALIGVGEAGREAVLPLNDKTYGEIASGISGGMSFDAAIDRLIAALPYIIANYVPDTLKVDNRAFARLVRSVQ